MKVILVHLSDIHIRTGDERILKSASAIAKAIGPLERRPEAVFILVSGDIAFSGLQSEYAYAEVFLRELKEELLSQYQATVDVILVTVPGNHDCDFTQTDAVRDMILKGVQDSAAIDPALSEHATRVQAQYFSFRERLQERNVSNKLFWEEEYKVGTGEVTIQCVNTAWMSTIEEKRGLIVFPEWRKKQSPADLVVAIFHHPPGWMKTESARSFQAQFESTSDILMSGHEHVQGSFKKSTDEGQCHYFEGGVLFESRSPNHSDFSVMVVDTVEKKYTASKFSRSGDKYVPASGYAAEERPFLRNVQRLKGQFQLSTKFSRELSDLGIAFSHPAKDTMYRADIYVRPNLKLSSAEQSADSKILSDRRESLLEYLQSRSAVLLLGDQGAGKSCFMKQTFEDLREVQIFSLLVDGKMFDQRTVSRVRILEALERQFDEIYDNADWNEFLQLPNKQRAILIDNFDRISLNETGKAQLVEILKTDFGLILGCADTIYRYQELLSGPSGVSMVGAFETVEILPFGNKQKLVMLKKWLLLGRETSFTNSELVQKMDSLEKVIKTIMNKELIPSYPLYVLLLLQQVETLRDHFTASGAYGDLFEHIIADSLKRDKAAKFGSAKILPYLGSYAYRMFSEGKQEFSLSETEEFHKRHCEERSLELEFDALKKYFLQCGIWETEAGNIRFKYAYIYYFFTAKHLSQNLDDEKVFAAIQDIGKKLFREDYANIFVFLAHFAQNWRIGEIAASACDEIFVDGESCDFYEDLKPIVSLASVGLDEMKLKLPSTGAEENRRQAAETADEIETRQKEAPANPGNELNRAFKAVHVAGQVLRACQGTFKKDQKIRVANSCFSVGLRANGFMVRYIAANASNFVEAIERSPAFSESAKKAQAGKLFGQIARMLVAGILQKVSMSVGCQDLRPTFNFIMQNNSDVGLRLIDLAIKLDQSGIEYAELQKAKAEFEKNRFALDILRIFVWHHLVYFETDFRAKQKVAKLFNFSMESAQRTLLLSSDQRKAQSGL